jgi:hypothetical protein
MHRVFMAHCVYVVLEIFTFKIEKIVYTLHNMMAINQLTLFLCYNVLQLSKLEANHSILFSQHINLFKLPTILFDDLLKFLFVCVQLQ